MITINSKELTMENRGVSYMEQTSHFARVLAFLEEKGWKYSHCCEDDCGSIDFEYRGVPYHIWEFHDGDEWGVETNIRHGGRSEELTGPLSSGTFPFPSILTPSHHDRANHSSHDTQ